MSATFEVGIDILGTTVCPTTKRILCQTGHVVGDTVDADGVELRQHVGIASRPPEAVKGKSSAQAIVIRQGGIDFAISTEDARGLELYGQLKPGETCVYAAGKDGKGQARTLYKDDGSIHHYTRFGNTADGAGMTVQVDATAGAIRLIGPKGNGIIIDGDGGVKVFTSGGAAALVLAASGDASLIGTGQTQVDGGGICIGSLAVPGLNSALTGVTGVAGKASLKCVIEIALGPVIGFSAMAAAILGYFIA